ncbi:MAG: FtsX-like permease family protein [Clostridia bacterium]|nr:FtsX-like permease family protein [Clostridia bacterium]
MKKTQFLDAIRNIKKRIVSYLSVVLIALLGTSIFLSIGFASKAIMRNGTNAYDSMHFRNIEVISTLLISEENIAALKALDGVQAVDPVWQAGASIGHDEQNADAAFVTVGEHVSVPEVLEGRLPENEDECAIEQSLAEALHLVIGDRIGDYSMTDDAGQYLIYHEFLVTGVVLHPDHLSTTFAQTPYVVVTKEAFDLETLQGACMKAEIAIGNANGNRFSEAHKKVVSTVIDRIETLAVVETPKTDAAVKAAAHAQIDAMEQANREDLEKARQETPPDEEQIAYLESRFESYAAYHESIENMAPCRWIVVDERGNTGFVQIATCSDTLRAIQLNFGLMFIVIGALTILATIGKMVNEQRTQVGTVKALGFYNREILQKYLLFAVSAVVIGTILGSLAARFFMEGVALNNYNESFAVDLSAPLFDWGLVLLVLFAGIILSVGAVWLSCRRLMKESANALMMPPVPHLARKAQTGKKHVLGLYARLILRNIRSDWKRVALTVVSILGCCAMIGIGFTLKSAVNNCTERQDSEILAYDASVEYQPYAEEEMQSIFDSAGVDSIKLYRTEVIVETESMGLATLLCGDVNEIHSMHRLLDWKTGQPLPSTDEGVYIYQRLAETEGLSVGSEIKLMIGLSDAATVRVAGVFKNYIGLTIVMSGDYYASQFGKDFTPNTFFVRLNGADQDALLTALDETWGLVSWTPSAGNRTAFEAATASINSVDALLIAIAAIMAGVVLLNLTNTFVLQKKRELIIMRINGFTVKELIGYLLRETAVTTVIGILLGVAAGCGIGYYIVRSVELPYTQFDRGVYAPAWLYAAGITALFAVVINAIALMKVKKLKLTDLT